MNFSTSKNMIKSLQLEALRPNSEMLKNDTLTRERQPNSRCSNRSQIHPKNYGEISL